MWPMLMLTASLVLGILCAEQENRDIRILRTKNSLKKRLGFLFQFDHLGAVKNLVTMICGKI
jgi:hypothetical protein